MIYVMRLPKAREFNLPSDYEFKFHALTARPLRERICEKLAEADFEVWSVVVDKTTSPKSVEIMSRLEFYTFFAAETMELIPVEKRQNNVLVLDEFGLPEAWVLKLRQYLKLRKMPRHYREMVAKRSRSEPLIQVTDFISGAILRRHAKSDSEAYDPIKKLKRIWNIVDKNLPH